MGANNKKKTHEEYVEELKIKNPDIEVIGKYVNAKTKILHKCLIHDIVFDKSPSEALTGSGCQQCHIDKMVLKRTKTHNQYVEELKINNPIIEVVEEYKGSLTEILHRCTVHNYEWMVSPANILKRNGCPKCNKKYHKTHNDYVEELKKSNPNLQVVGTYINAKTKILHKCLIHNIDWMVSPDNALKGVGCKKCVVEATITRCTKTNEQYIRELSTKNSNIEVLEEYQNTITPILHRCKICNHKWMAAPSNLLSGTSCPMCNISNGEYQVKDWLEKHNYIYEPQKKFSDCKDKNPLPFDFYLPEYNVCIEYDGEQHYKPVSFGSGNKKHIEEIFEYTQRHDQIKNEYCKSKGIRLIRIPYFDDVKEKLDLLLT